MIKINVFHIEGKSVCWTDILCWIVCCWIWFRICHFNKVFSTIQNHIVHNGLKVDGIVL